MGLFRPYEQGQGRKGEPGDNAAASAPAAGETASSVDPEFEQGGTSSESAAARTPQKKNRPTPTRAEAEAARMQRLHPNLTKKEQRKLERETQREARWKAMESAEKLPERRLARNWVDTRHSIIGWIMPIMLVILAVQMAYGKNLVVVQWTAISMMVIFAYLMFSLWWTWRGLKKELLARGLNPKQRGLFSYQMNRMMTMRGMRRPAPVVKRGDAI